MNVPAPFITYFINNVSEEKLPELHTIAESTGALIC